MTNAPTKPRSPRPPGLKKTLDDKIAKKQAKLEKIEERLGYLMAERATVESELGALLSKRRAMAPSLQAGR